MKHTFEVKTDKFWGFTVSLPFSNTCPFERRVDAEHYAMLRNNGVSHDDAMNTIGINFICGRFYKDA